MVHMRGLEAPQIGIIIPSTGRPEQCARLVGRILETARSSIRIVVSVEPDDVKPYARALAGFNSPSGVISAGLTGLVWDQTGQVGPGSHVAAINRGARSMVTEHEPAGPEETTPKIIIKLDDDHWPLTIGWDALYLNALNDLGGTGVVYGNDLFQGENLPTVPGLSADIVRALGWYAPPVLGHLFCDNYWLELGRRSGLIKYLPDVQIQHRHPNTPHGATIDATYRAGGLSQDRWMADERTWQEICSVPIDANTTITGPRGWPSAMDIWADRVKGLAARKGWKP